jgi:hypothetical protein
VEEREKKRVVSLRQTCEPYINSEDIITIWVGWEKAAKILTTIRRAVLLGPVWRGFFTGFRSCLEPFCAKWGKKEWLH